MKINSSLSFEELNQKQSKELGFIENKGQLDPNVLFYLQLKGQNILITNKGYTYDNFKVKGDFSNHHRIDVVFQNRFEQSIIKAESSSGFYNNYYLNGIEVIKVKTYASVTILNLYQGIDIRYYIDKKSESFKFDYIIHPGANLQQIKFKILGGETKIKNNELIINTSLGHLVESIPLSYILETAESIEIKYTLFENKEFGLFCEKSIIRGTLIIDPTPNLSWATYHGGSSNDDYYRSIVDSNNYIYNCGFSSSTNNISTSGAFQTSLSSNFDCLITKFDTSGKILWSTYYGGTGLDQAKYISLDNKGGVYIVGITSSSAGMASSGAYLTTLPGSNAGLIAKFNTNGTRLWSTYYGGPGVDEFYGACTDSTGNIYAVGKTTSSSGIATIGVHSTTYVNNEDGMIVKMDGNGNRIWGTYIGGSNQDYVQGIYVNSSNSIFVNGFTLSNNSITLNAIHQSTFGGGGDAFIAKFDQDAKLQWSTYFGGSQVDVFHTIVSDTKNLLFFAGFSNSSNSIASTGAYQTTYNGASDAIIACFDTLGNKIWATYYGSSKYDEAYQINYFNSYLTIGGRTSSSTNISTSKAYKTNYTGGVDIFLVRFDKYGNRIWGTYYGGSGDDILIGCYTFGNSIVISGNTTSASSFATSGSHQNSFGGSKDAYILKFDFDICDDYKIKINYSADKLRCHGDSNGIAIVHVQNGLGP